MQVHPQETRTDSCKQITLDFHITGCHDLHHAHNFPIRSPNLEKMLPEHDAYTFGTTDIDADP